MPESGRAKVDELDAEVLVDDDVLVLEVAVEDAVVVEVVDGSDDLQRGRRLCSVKFCSGLLTSYELRL